MAFTRDGFKNQLEHKLVGAIIHHYQAELAKANGKNKWVVHWSNESKRLLVEFRTLLSHSIKGTWSRTKAAKEVVTLMKRNDKQYRRVAYNVVCRDFRSKLSNTLPERTKFWDRVGDIISDS
jgi:hypothetical protein